MPFVPDDPSETPGRFVPDKKKDEFSLADNVVGSVIEPALAMGSGAIAAPVSNIAGMGAALYESLFGGPGGQEPRLGATPQGFQKYVQQGLTYEPRTPAGKAVTEYNPLALLGKGVDWVGDKMGQIAAPPGTSGPARSALGYGVAEAVKQAPGFIGIGAPPVAAATAGGLKDAARGTMQSALKPTYEKLRTGKAASAIDTMLDEGINVTKGGMEKMQNRIDALNANIAGIIDNSPATIDKAAVGSRVNTLLQKFQKQVTPLSDVAAIQKAWDEFMNHPLIPGPTMPVKTAQELKQGTYRSLSDKAYGELKGADIEAQKALARGLKEEIAAAVPEVRALNAEESKLLNALSVTERRVLMEANKNPAGLGWLTTSPTHFAGWMADRSGLFKSIVARMLNTASEAVPPIGAAGVPIGLAVGQYAQRPDQIPPPP